MWPFADLVRRSSSNSASASFSTSRPKVISSSRAQASSSSTYSPFITTMDEDRDEDSIMGSDLSHDDDEEDDEEEIEGRVDVVPDAAEFFQAFLGDHQQRGGGRVRDDQDEYGHRRQMQRNNHHGLDDEEEDLDEDEYDPLAGFEVGIEERIQRARPLDEDSESDGKEDEEVEDDDDDEEDEDDDNTDDILVAGAYNEEEYIDLPVTEDIQSLFKYIGRYRPIHHSLETRFKPFIQDYIPAVGDIDAFIKLPRPDGLVEPLGKTFLDEPAAQVNIYLACS